MNYADQYLNTIKSILETIEDKERPAIHAAASLVASTLSQGGFLYTFGTGHSHMLAEEVFYRAGGLVRVYPIFAEPLMLHNGAENSSQWERTSGLAQVILRDTPIKSGDTIIICSNSGRNAVPVEMASCCRDMGVHVIALTNMEHTLQSSPRNPLGKNLYELADVVLDNHGCVGDAALPTPLGINICPTSTAIGAVLLQMVVARAVERMLQQGIPLECFHSSNVDGGGEMNEAYCKKYKSFIRPL